MSNVLPLYSNNMVYLNVLHKYGEAITKDFYDLFICMDELTLLYLYVIDKVNFRIHKREMIHYHNDIKDCLIEEYGEVLDIYLYNVEGFWRRVDDTIQVVLFMYFRDHKGKSYVFELAFNDFDTSEYTFKFLKSISDNYDAYVGLLIKKDFVYTDYKSIEAYDTYLMHIKDGMVGVAGKKVYGYRVLVTTEEKEEYKQKYDTDIEITDFPYVVFERSHVIYALPDDVIKTKFNFSRGLVFTKFSSEQNKEFENFKV